MARSLITALLLLGAAAGGLAQEVSSSRPGRSRPPPWPLPPLSLQYTARWQAPPPPPPLQQITVSGAGCASSLQPGAPQELKAQPGDGKVTLTWKPPANGGCVDEYRVSAAPLSTARALGAGAPQQTKQFTVEVGRRGGEERAGGGGERPRLVPARPPYAARAAAAACTHSPAPSTLFFFFFSSKAKEQH